MSKYLDFFDDVYYINLDYRTDRRENFEKRSTEVGMDAIRFSAIQPDIEKCKYMNFWNSNFSNDLIKVKMSEIGCALSHIEIIKNAKERNLNNVFILEDDCVFLDIFKDEIQNCINDIKENDIEWDIIYFGGEPNNFCKKITENIYIIENGGVYGTHSYAVNKNFYDKILNFSTTFNIYNELIEFEGIRIIAIDQYLLHCTNKKYLLSKKLLTMQDTNYSDIRDQIIEKSNSYVFYWNKYVN